MATTTGQLDRLAAAGRELIAATTLDEALTVLARATGAATAATAVVIRVPGGDRPAARGLWCASAALQAELEGSPGSLANRHPDDDVLVVSAEGGEHPLATLELFRPGGEFTTSDRTVAEIVANQAALLVRAFESQALPANGGLGATLELAGRALTAGTEETRTAERIARLVAEVTHAESCLVWRAEGGSTTAIGWVGISDGLEGLAAEGERELTDRNVALHADGESPVAYVRLGEPAIGGLRLTFAGVPPTPDELERLAAFGARAAHAVRVGERTTSLTQELERSRALLEVVGQAIAELSLSHTLDTAVDRVAELLGTKRVAVYLHFGRDLETAAERGLAGPHLRVARALHTLALGRLRPRAVAEIPDASAEPGLAGVRDAVSEAGVDGLVAVQLRAGNELIGLLVAYLPGGRRLHANESALLAALAGQLAVAVQNAGLHEQAMQLARDRAVALESERRAARRLEAFFEISRAFSESLELEQTLAAVTKTAVELFGVDAAVLRLPEGRGEDFVVRSLHIPDPRLAEALAPILTRPQPAARLTGLGLGRARKALVLDPVTAEHLGGGHELLAPFLQRGSSAVIVPIVASGEVIAALTLLELDPAQSFEAETVETLRSLAAQAALAIDNARLYQQQAGFADAMQRSLLPAARPELPGLDVGSVYESSARLDVGGDVYDYVLLPDGRLAVVVGDVTGKGIDAAADMAMTKFVFRSLAREHHDPSDFLRAANEVVVGEVEEGKFVTMAYVTIDPRTGEIACASAGHPSARLISSDGRVLALESRGLALGIANDQRYEEAHETLEPGSAVVLFTDGVVEARRDGELYGLERLDRLLAERRGLEAGAIARAVVDGAKMFAGGELGDDSAVVVVKRTSS